MSIRERMESQWLAREADWKGGLRRAFRFRTFRWELGRWCWIVHPVQGCPDICWWEWQQPNAEPWWRKLWRTA